MNSEEDVFVQDSRMQSCLVPLPPYDAQLTALCSPYEERVLSGMDTTNDCSSGLELCLCLGAVGGLGPTPTTPPHRRRRHTDTPSSKKNPDRKKLIKQQSISEPEQKWPPHKHKHTTSRAWPSSPSSRASSWGTPAPRRATTRASRRSRRRRPGAPRRGSSTSRSPRGSRRRIWCV